ncbi:hypothetical protein [Sphingobacterium haloxyli]|uniref:Uncharacterized protein n=1 Tax=Sphingobacterium haloxyli TaxID=2100533 RepID=A0A2S9J867_9SPHI|nr:hypothetical protein [Sphingobacterium haloxyli]PRD48929.1 hypothetical protein C5745_03050 [Sphingobacterium haloxyli]
MTFEDFFAKKKIDLSQLRGDNGPLYEEFRQHYAQMGEKSFDHTKKFWFNKLRKQYALTEEVETAVKDESVAVEILEELSPRSKEAETPSSKPAGFKPRFKAGATKAAEPEKPKEEHKPETSETPTSKPAGFKPRFKAGATKAAEPEKPKEEHKPETSETPTSKPAGFKPRFKAGATKAAEPEKPKEEHKPETSETPTSKPAGFKPRFKAGATKTQPPKSEGE